jgi:hypothetical protein
MLLVCRFCFASFAVQVASAWLPLFEWRFVRVQYAVHMLPDGGIPPLEGCFGCKDE